MQRQAMSQPEGEERMQRTNSMVFSLLAVFVLRRFIGASEL
jgi:hypothetical protein